MGGKARNKDRRQYNLRAFIIMKFKAFIFDFRDTLLRVNTGYKEANKVLFQFITRRKKISHKNFIKIFISVIKEHKSNKKTVHDWSRLYTTKLLEKLGFNLSKKELEKIFAAWEKAFVSKVELFPDAVRLLKTLKVKRIKTAVVIDGTSKRERTIIRKLGLGKFLNVIVISEEVGLNKFTPMPLITALKKLKAKPNESLAVGDRVDKDIVHANKLGCFSVRLIRNRGRYANMVGLKTNEKPKLTINSLDELAKFIN